MAHDGTLQVHYAPFRTPVCWALKCEKGKQHVVAAECLRGEIESGRLDVGKLVKNQNSEAR